MHAKRMSNDAWVGQGPCLTPVAPLHPDAGPGGPRRPALSHQARASTEEGSAAMRTACPHGAQSPRNPSWILAKPTDILRNLLLPQTPLARSRNCREPRILMLGWPPAGTPPEVRRSHTQITCWRPIPATINMDRRYIFSLNACDGSEHVYLPVGLSEWMRSGARAACI